jgi:hypothetical protein
MRYRQQYLIHAFVDALPFAVQLDIHLRRIALEKNSGGMGNLKGQVLDVDLFDVENRLGLITHVGDSV